MSIGRNTFDYKDMDLEFKEVYGRNVVFRGMSNDAPRIISAKRMEGIFIHGDVIYVVECLVTTENPMVVSIMIMWASIHF
jgi:hypothetical protein